MRFLLASVLLLLASSANAQRFEVLIKEPSNIDRQYMEQQRDVIRDLAARHLGRRLSGTRDNDLEVLQALLDRRLVRPDQTSELQAMGIIMGDLLAEDLNLHWVIYIDKIGRSRALRFRKSDNYLFPVTLIARRREAGDLTPVAVVYASARDGMLEDLPPMPFQPKKP